MRSPGEKMSKVICNMLVLVFAGWAGSVSAAPIPGADIVTVGGRDWAQVDLFAGLSWNNIDAQCPGGICGAGTLNGFDMSGWRWASADDLAATFNPFLVDNGFGGDDLLGPGPDRFYWGFSNPRADFGRNFIDQGFRPTYQQFGDRILTGWISNLVPGDTGLAHQGVVGDYPGQVQGALFGTDFTQQKQRGGLFSPGAWFFYAGSEVPAPATLPLLLIGVVAAYVARLNRRVRASAISATRQSAKAPGVGTVCVATISSAGLLCGPPVCPKTYSPPVCESV